MLRVSGAHNLIYVLEILSHCMGIIGRMNGSRNNLESRSGWQVGAKRPGSMELWHLRKLGWMDLCVELEKVETQQEVVALEGPENSSRLAVLVPTLLCLSPLGIQLKCRFDSPGVGGGGGDALLTGSQVMLMLLILGPTLSNKGPGGIFQPLREEIYRHWKDQLKFAFLSHRIWLRRNHSPISGTPMTAERTRKQWQRCQQLLQWQHWALSQAHE